MLIGGKDKQKTQGVKWLFGANGSVRQIHSPLDIVNWDYNDYIEKFLPERRKLMAQRIKEYYNKL